MPLAPGSFLTPREALAAAEGGHTEAVRLLLADPRVDPEEDRNRAVWKAAGCGHIETVRLMLKDDRVFPFDRKNSGFEYAAESGHRDVVKLLLEDWRYERRHDIKTPFMMACIGIVWYCILVLRG